MTTRPVLLSACALLLGVTVPLVAVAQEEAVWDQKQVTALVAALHEGVKGLRDEIRSNPRDIGTLQAQAYHRLMDNLRLIERETRHLHSALESGSGRDETRPSYARIAILRRECEEEMERQYLGSPALGRVKRARSIVKELDPYYGLDPERPDHERVLGR